MIPTEKPGTPAELVHHGIKGMRWGVRREQTTSKSTGIGPDKLVRKTKNGDVLVLTKRKPGVGSKILARMSSNYRQAIEHGASLNISDKSGKKIGNFSMWKKSNDELYLNWIDIDKSARGKGYATAAMKAAMDVGRKEGVKKITLEVPGNSPDARHIYEKLGFKVTKEDIDPSDPVWGGLTEMEYRVK